MWSPPVPSSRAGPPGRGSAFGPLLEDGRLTLLNGSRRVARPFLQQLVHHALRERTGTVLWCDGDHGFDPYAFAERNLEHGFEADRDAERVLIKRCMTPFQWDTVLTRHLDQKLLDTQTSLVIAAPYDRLFSTDELVDWEQEDYVRYSLKHLRRSARRHRVPIMIAVDMARWWLTHPTLARMAFEGADARWSVKVSKAVTCATDDVTGETIREPSRRTVTLYDFEDEVEIPAVRGRPRARRMMGPKGAGPSTFANPPHEPR